MTKTKVGIVGCGNISGIYLKNLTSAFAATEVAAVCDIIPERAQKAAQEYGIKKVYTRDEDIFQDSEIEIILNITDPLNHYPVTMGALRAGKHVHSEKPLADTRAKGREIVELAREKGLLLGNAPDTFMGAGIQTCRKVLDDGWIGRPIGFSAKMLCHGHESWHPDPEFYYRHGGGPMFDMGPYYLTALVFLLGPVSRVFGFAKKGFAKRIITSEKKFGSEIEVEVPTHVVGLMEFKNGVTGDITTTFDVWDTRGGNNYIEIYGTDGTLRVPDPNGFGGPVLLYTRYDRTWREISLCSPFAENYRGVGVADMAHALRTGRANRASGELAFHVRDIMEGFHDASASGKPYRLRSSCRRPDPVPTSLAPGLLD